MKQQKSTLYDKLIPVLLKPFLDIRTSNDLRVQTINIFRTQLGKNWDEVHQVYNRGVKVSELFLFSAT